ncbi:hypothetical protein HK103_002199 [Boothiomyces macroporosus]|uniref:ER membrane protein complex subunit 7 beta-sandwich domain-containing protein n=1 Tax=Boothiomyces macroporosus TaxID=261099 RepID=A0AAD5U9I3_9FUNG|nr:hypothetical protein HK103_002199 [Boothiomyces macroporosus]
MKGYKFSADKNLLLAQGKQLSIYSLDPKPIKQAALDYQVSSVDILDSTNLIAFAQDQIVTLYDLYAQVRIAEVSFNTQVKNVRLCTGRLIISTFKKIFVYTLEPVKLYEYDCYNAVNDVQSGILVFSSPFKGSVQLVDIGKEEAKMIPFTLIISGHDNPVQHLAVSSDGQFTASCSVKGTLIRVWDNKTGGLIKEIRRGQDEARIYSLAFDVTGQLVACTSDKNTVHLFNLNDGFLSKRIVYSLPKGKSKVQFVNSEYPALQVVVNTAVLSATITGQIVADARLLQDYLTPSTKIYLNQYQAFVKRNGVIEITVPDGTYILSVVSPSLYFDPIRLEVSGDTVKAFDGGLGISFNTALEVPYPLELQPKGMLTYFQPVEQFNIWGLFANPMIIMTLATLFFVFIIPKLKDSINDPEIRKEMEEAAKKKQAPVEIPDVGDIAGNLADWFGGKPKAKAVEQEKTPEKSKKKNKSK